MFKIINTIIGIHSNELNTADPDMPVSLEEWGDCADDASG
jgi:hypothetical protein